MSATRALRGSPLVNAETRKRVEDAVRELNYKVDRHASSLRTQRAGTLALLLFEDPTSDESHINPFFLSMLGSITRACAKQGQDLLVSFQQLSDDWHADYEDSMKADGLILLGYGDYLAYRDKLDQLVENGTHFVRWGAVLPDQPGLSIGCDNFTGGRHVGEHLLERGRRRVAFLGEASNRFPEFFARYRGCEAALADAGVAMDAGLQVDAESSEQDGHAAATELLHNATEFTHQGRIELVVGGGVNLGNLAKIVDSLKAADHFWSVHSYSAVLSQGRVDPQKVAAMVRLCH